MMWYLQPLLEWGMSAQGSNLLFAVLCLAQLTGVPGRALLIATALLHVFLATL